MSNKREQLLGLIEADIAQDCSDYQALRELMQGLYEQLMARNVEQIAQSNLQIEALVESVRARAARRVRALQAFSLEADAAGMQRLLAGYPAPRRDVLRASWRQLGQLAQECKALNERNGQLLAMHNEILSQLFAAPTETGLYGRQPY